VRSERGEVRKAQTDGGMFLRSRIVTSRSTDALAYQGSA
jgi:hypothetical protein